MQELMKGKKGIVFGVANDKSIAWGITQKLAEQGAELALTYQGDALKKRVIPLGESIGVTQFHQVDSSDEDTIDTCFTEIEKAWGKLDFIVHSIAFSDKDELKGEYYHTSRANFLNTLDISCYSLTALVQRAVPLMRDGGSILTLSYYGAERVMPHYNVMGVAKAALEASVRYLAADLGKLNIRVNAISAGPIKTLAASGIGDFRYILRWNELNAPLGRNVTPEDVGSSALYLLSDLSSAVTGELHHVDAGYHTVGMIATEKTEEINELLSGLNAKS